MEFALRSGETVFVDPEHAHILSLCAWRYARRGNKPKGDKFYVVGRVGGRHAYLHRVVVGAEAGQIVDHINGDTLDNRLSNLRVVTAAQNMQNRVKPNTGKQTSRFKGVSLSKSGWRACIRPQPGKSILLGAFETEVEAALAYDVASLRYHGEHGRRNFLPLV